MLALALILLYNQQQVKGKTTTRVGFQVETWKDFFLLFKGEREKKNYRGREMSKNKILIESFYAFCWIKKPTTKETFDSREFHRKKS